MPSSEIQNAKHVIDISQLYAHLVLNQSSSDIFKLEYHIKNTWLTGCVLVLNSRNNDFVGRSHHPRLGMAEELFFPLFF
jgi:hypothetical protein